MRKYKPEGPEEGYNFEAKFCDRCKKEDTLKNKHCTIHFTALVYDPSDEVYPKEWIYGEKEQPTCTAFVKR